MWEKIKKKSEFVKEVNDELILKISVKRWKTENSQDNFEKE